MGKAAHFKGKSFHHISSKKKALSVEVGMIVEGTAMRLVWLTVMIGDSQPQAWANYPGLMKKALGLG